MPKRYTTPEEIRRALWDGKNHHSERVRVSIGREVIEDCRLFDCRKSREWKDGKVLKYYFCQNEKNDYVCANDKKDKFGYKYSWFFFDDDANDLIDWFEFVEEPKKKKGETSKKMRGILPVGSAGDVLSFDRKTKVISWQALKFLK